MASISDKNWLQTIQKYGKRCWYCGRRAASIDHAVPTSRGGQNKPFNMLPACRDCNTLKGSSTIGEFRKVIRTQLRRRLVSMGQFPKKLTVTFYGEGNQSPFYLKRGEVNFLKPEALSETDGKGD